MKGSDSFIEQVIIVDEHDRETGHMEKLAAHQADLMHRAFSVFVFDSSARLMLQQRAESKYHSGGLWSNTCCGHPRPGEAVSSAAERRLKEEMGLECELTSIFHFKYRAELNDGLIENELDHVVIGISTDVPEPDPNEAMAWRWVERDELEQEISQHPERFTAWFPLCVWQAWDHASEKVLGV